MKRSILNFKFVFGSLFRRPEDLERERPFQDKLPRLDRFLLWDGEFFEDVHHDGQDGDLTILRQDDVRNGGNDVGTLL